MIPDGTSPEAIVAAVVITALVGCGLMAALFWYRFPESHKKIVNHFRSAMSFAQSQTVANERTDRTDDADGLVSVADQWLDRIELDRTRTAVMEILLTSGWTITDMRREGIFRGENATISAEVEATKKKLGIVGEPRQLRVRDAEGERLIPMDA
jgi:hypothetical protein